MSFEKFSGLLKKSIDTLTECGRAPHNGDIVDALWSKIQNAELIPYISALKVQYQMNGRTFQELLQDIASQVPNLTQASKNFRNVSELGTQNENSRNGNMDLSKVTQTGDCPDDGVYTSKGKLFVGTYSGRKWTSPSVKPHHDKIRKARDKLKATKRNGKGNSRNAKWKQDLINKNSRLVSKMQNQIQELQNQVQGSNGNNLQQEASNPNNSNEGGNNTNDNAGSSFGGRSSRSSGGSQVSKIKTSSRERVVLLHLMYPRGSSGQRTSQQSVN